MSTRLVYTVVIYNTVGTCPTAGRSDNCLDRLRNIQIRIGDVAPVAGASDPSPLNALCFAEPLATSPATPLSVPVSSIDCLDPITGLAAPARGRYLSIQIMSPPPYTYSLGVVRRAFHHCVCLSILSSPSHCFQHVTILKPPSV